MDWLYGLFFDEGATGGTTGAEGSQGGQGQKPDKKPEEVFKEWGEKVLEAITELGKKVSPPASGSQSQGTQGQGQAQGSVTVVVPPGPMGDQDKPKPKKGFLSRMVDSLYQ